MKTFYSVTYSHIIPNSTQAIYGTSYTWTMRPLPSFDELLISWNAQRPLVGHYVILSRVFIQEQWSPWLLYAVWESQHQYSFHDSTSEAPVHSFQDQVEVLDGEVATGFCIRIEACNGASLENITSLFGCTSRLNIPWPIASPNIDTSVSLPIPNISQLSLNHPRARSLCSPTSLTAVIQYLLAHQQPQPLPFAKQVYDAGFDIYGNWSFNVAQAFVELGSLWQCFCTRVANLEWLWQSLKQKLPVVISVKGKLPGNHLPYTSGHLLVIKGYDAVEQQFLCMDPAFPSDAQTEMAYPWEALIQAWASRHYLAYFLFPRSIAVDEKLEQFPLHNRWPLFSYELKSNIHPNFEHTQ